MPTIKEISIKDPSGSGFNNRDIGAEAQNVEVSYDASGNIIEDIHAAGVTVDHTQGVPKAFKDIQTDMGGKAPTNHAASDGTYGVASTANFGHVRVGAGLSDSSGTISVAYGNAANTACEGNDERLSDARNTPNKVTFNNGGSGDASGAEFNGSAAKTVSYNTIGAAPTSHASSATTYGVASTANYGHVKTSTGITNSSGTISVAYGTTAGTACQGNDSRLSNARTPTAHASTATTYGVATTAAYGHVKTSTGITNSSGTISVAYGTAAGTACQGNDSRLSNSRTPTAHAYSTTAYGGATASCFGHVKLSDTYTSNVGAAANSIAASQTALYNVYTAYNNLRLTQKWYAGSFTAASNSYLNVTASDIEFMNNFVHVRLNLQCKAAFPTFQSVRVGTYNIQPYTGAKGMPASAVHIISDQGNPMFIEVGADNNTTGYAVIANRKNTMAVGDIVYVNDWFPLNFN